MSSDSNIPEANLRNVQPATLDDALLARLEAACEGTLVELSSDELKFEAWLRGFAPGKLSASLLNELHDITAGLPFAVDEKILMFPGRVKTPSRRPAWAAAAAVAILGASVALLVPQKSGRHSAAPVASSTPSHSVAAPLVSHELVPAGFNRDVSDVHDEGVVFQDGNRPRSMVRVTYKDKAIFKDEHGRTFVVEEPRVGYLTAPAHAD